MRSCLATGSCWSPVSWNQAPRSSCPEAALIPENRPCPPCTARFLKRPDGRSLPPKSWGPSGVIPSCRNIISGRKSSATSTLHGLCDALAPQARAYIRPYGWIRVQPSKTLETRGIAVLPCAILPMPSWFARTEPSANGSRPFLQWLTPFNRVGHGTTPKRGAAAFPGKTRKLSKPGRILCDRSPRSGLPGPTRADFL